MKLPTHKEFLFAPQHKLTRHVLYWAAHAALWALFWVVMGVPLSYGRQLVNMLMWVPCFILFSYPLIYGAIPHLLLKGKIAEFFLVLMGWGAAGLYIDEGYRAYVLIPAQEAMGLKNILPRGPLAFCFLCMTTSAVGPMVLKFFKLWFVKQEQWVQEQQEKARVELQLLKAEVQPHFLRNTLDNIYSLSLHQSVKTPALILKLSALLSYILYDCKADEVLLEKEVSMMKSYVDLEQERCGEKMEVSWNVEGDIKAVWIAPLLFLPFLENAFKHNGFEQLEQPWVGVDISVQQGILYCQIANSKVETGIAGHDSKGISRVQQRLNAIYANRHELKMNDEGDFFAVSLQLRLDAAPVQQTVPQRIMQPMAMVPA